MSDQESRKLSDQKREKAEEVLREHKKREREMVKQGKTPYYLKKCKSWVLFLFARF